MKIIEDLEEMRRYIIGLKQGFQISFIPTMGALHKGHLSLIKTAYATNPHAKIIISIFANPTQFTNQKDFDAYPDTLNTDIEKLLDLQNKENIEIDCVFVPKKNKDFYSDTKYPQLKKYNIDVSNLVLPSLFSELEGEARKGHFEGVFQVLFRLFGIISPDYVIFGQKDMQQILLVQYLQKKYYPHLEIYIADIFREKSGLAMSSRNERLSAEEKKKAKILYEALQVGVSFAQKSLYKKNSVAVVDILDIVTEKLSSEKLVQKIYYIEIRNRGDFSPVKTLQENEAYVMLLSVQFAGLHLIDNIIF